MTGKLSFLGLGDLRKRWSYTRQALHFRMKEDKQFPKPYAIINDGKTKIWLLADIVVYEKLRANLLRRNDDLNFKVYCRNIDEYNMLSETEKKAIAQNNPYSRLNK